MTSRLVFLLILPTTDALILPPAIHRSPLRCGAVRCSVASSKELPENFVAIPGAEAVVVGDGNGDVLDEIEHCKLIEKPHQTTVGPNLTHHIRDMPGYCAEIPCLRPNCDVREPKSVVEKDCGKRH